MQRFPKMRTAGHLHINVGDNVMRGDRLVHLPVQANERVDHAGRKARHDTKNRCESEP